MAIPSGKCKSAPGRFVLFDAYGSTGLRQKTWHAHPVKRLKLAARLKQMRFHITHTPIVKRFYQLTFVHRNHKQRRCASKALRRLQQ